MANLITDGFDWFPTGKNVATRALLWGADSFYKVNYDAQGAPTADVATGRFAFGKAILWNYSQSATSNFFNRMNGYVIPVGSSVVTGFIGVAMYIDEIQNSTAGGALGFYDAVNDTFQVCVTFDANGVVRLYLGNPGSGVVIATSAAGCFQENEWFHAEIKGTIDNTSGFVEVRINTVPVLQVTSTDTQNTATASFDSVFIGVKQPSGQTGDIKTYIDDLFVNDTTGSSNNNWAGNLRVKTQFMTANGATNDFTIGGTSPAATNWQSVLNQNLDDGQYVFSSTVGHIDLYTPDPNLNAPLVRCVQVRMGLRQDDATQRVARGLLRIGGVNYLGTIDQYTNQTYTFYKERWQLSPATGVTFTGTEVNGLQAGLKVQA